MFYKKKYAVYQVFILTNFACKVKDQKCVCPPHAGTTAQQRHVRIELRLSVHRRFSGPFVESFASDSPSNVILCLNRRNPHTVLQHDNARPHVARITRDALQNLNVDVLQNWPELSPDLNLQRTH